MLSSNKPIQNKNFASVDLEFIQTISINDMYAFIAYCQTELHASAGTRARKIVSIRQFWKYLKTKAHLIENNLQKNWKHQNFQKGYLNTLALRSPSSC